MASSARRFMSAVVVFSALGACSGDDDAKSETVSRETCDVLAEVGSACYDNACAGGEDAQTPFCGCWLQNQDINAASCTCTPLDWQAACAQLPAEMTPAQVRAAFSCQAATNLVLGVCTR